MRRFRAWLNAPSGKVLGWCFVFFSAVGAIIQSGATADLLTVDPTSLALRASLYDPNGNALVPKETYRGSVRILVRQSAATGAGAAVFGVYNSNGTKTVRVVKIRMQFGFDGTGAATNMRYEWIKATGITTFSGGTLETASQFRGAFGAPVSAVARTLDTGLTTTGATFGGPVAMFGWSRLTQSATQSGAWSSEFVLEQDPLRMGPIELANQEALILRNGPTNASVIGDTVLGAIYFVEL